MPSDQVGDTLEVSLWYNAEHPREVEDARAGIYKALIKTEEAHGLRLGPVGFEDLAPGMDRVPAPPPHFAGKPRLLIGYADVIRLVTVTVGDDTGFTQDLTPHDLTNLRRITQRAYDKSNPGAHPLSNEQLDATINEIGPEVAMNSLKANTDQRTLN